MGHFASLKMIPRHPKRRHAIVAKDDQYASQKTIIQHLKRRLAIGPKDARIHHL